MPDSTINNKRIAKNTLLLYFRMMLLMLVQLYTSRVVLKVLGVEDYGIYNVVGGIVAMLGFLNNAMMTSTLRYVTYELGQNNFIKLRQVFVTSVNIHLLISLIVLILGETVGVWFLLNQMNIPDERMIAAEWVYQMSLLTTIVAIMSYPYNAMIVAHEKMSAFAFISVLEAILKLLVVYLLGINCYDKLILYAVFIAAIQLLIRFCYSSYCSRHFHEAKYYLFYNRCLFKEMLGFAGWNLWGNLAGILFGQGLNLLLNMFFGPVVNAARAIAIQVQGAIQNLSINFQMALNPQITKTYAAKLLENMHRLIFRSSKITFCLLFIISLPVLIETSWILKLWLEVVPCYTSTFLRIMIVTMIIDSAANPLMTAAAASGNVKKYQSVIGGILLSIVPISYVVLKMGGAPWTVFVVHLIICCVAYITRLFIVRPLIGLQVRQYSKEVILRCIMVAMVAVLIPLFLHFILHDTIVKMLIVILSSIISAIICSFYIGLNKHEQSVIRIKVNKAIKKMQGNG